MKKLSTKKIAVLSLMIAMIVLFSRYMAIETQLMKFSFTFIPQAVTGALFGPLWSIIANVIADFIGMWIAPKAQFFIGFTLNAVVTGAIYGYFFNKRPINWQNIMMACLLESMLVHLFLTPLWLHIMYKIPFWAMILPRLLKECIVVPLQVFILILVMKRFPLKQFEKSKNSRDDKRKKNQ